MIIPYPRQKKKIFGAPKIRFCHFLFLVRILQQILQFFQLFRRVQISPGFPERVGRGRPSASDLLDALESASDS